MEIKSGYFIIKVITRLCNMIVSFILIGVFILFGLLYGPMLFGYSAYSIVSRSMEPEYSMGVLIYEKSVPFEQLKKGDIVSFYIDDIEQKDVVTHMLVEKNEEERWVRTKGIANQIEDLGKISANQILGKVMGKIPYLGYVNLFFQTKAGFIVQIFIPVLLLFLTTLGSILSKEEIKKLKS